MNTFLNNKKNFIAASALSILLGSAAVAAPALADTQVRLKSSNDAAAFSEGYALSVEDWSSQTRSARNTDSRGFHHQSQGRPQVWISDIGTLLFDDYDGDGYHSGFSLTIDIDSEYGDTEVYARIYLQPTDGTAALLHKTGRFSVYGTTVGDEYRIDTELRNNYASDDYDVSIDIHDAWSDELLDTANARGFTNLRQLPLESVDQNQHESYDEDQYNDDESNDDIVVTEYAGALHPLLFLILTGGALLRRRKS